MPPVSLHTRTCVRNPPLQSAFNLRLRSSWGNGVEDREHKHELELERLASIVESSEDAIISKSLDGIIRTWNAGATKIFGYQPEEMIGQSILKLVPPELHDEEAGILGKLRRGERIHHFDTVRLAKDGRRIDIALTVSPLRDRSGRVVGASKIARDVSERKQAERLQRLLMDELNHRVKNTLAIVQSVASQSIAFASSPDDFLDTFSGRLRALSSAHDLLIRERMQGINLRDLVESQLFSEGDGPVGVSVEGPQATIRGSLVTHLALILHELATNARKHGAFASPDGEVSVRWALKPGSARTLDLVWEEKGVPATDRPASPGFGMQLIEKTLAANDGSASIDFRPDGILVHLQFDVQDRDDIENVAAPGETSGPANPAVPVTNFEGLKALIVEDEAIVAMDLEMKFEQLGFDIAGMASSVPEAIDLLSRTTPDIALLDANLHGERVDAIAGLLEERAIPFAFASGYGREALPKNFADRELLSKPFSDARLVQVLSRLAGRALAGRT